MRKAWNSVARPPVKLALGLKAALGQTNSVKP